MRCWRYQKYFGTAPFSTEGLHRQGADEQKGSVLGLSIYSVVLGGGRLHIQASVLGVCEAGSKLILRAQDGWRPFSNMGGGSSKNNDKSVAGIVDNSSKLSKDFTIIKLHGGTSAMVAGVVATALLLYVAYKLFAWRKAKMSQAAQRPRQGMGRVVARMGEGEGPGRFPRRLPAIFRPLQPAPGHPMPSHEELCEECQQEAGYEALRGHFPPVNSLV